MRRRGVLCVVCRRGTAAGSHNMLVRGVRCVCVGGVSCTICQRVRRCKKRWEQAPTLRNLCTICRHGECLCTICKRGERLFMPIIKSYGVCIVNKGMCRCGGGGMHNMSARAAAQKKVGASSHPAKFMHDMSARRVSLHDM